MSKLKKKVLIVDDNASIRESVRLSIQELNQFDFNIVESSDVASGIEQLKKINPDIVILDLYMPDKSGFDFMDIMNKSKNFTNTKVIMLTVGESLENIFTAEEKGISPYYFIRKPYNISDLQALVLSLSIPSKA